MRTALLPYVTVMNNSTNISVQTALLSFVVFELALVLYKALTNGATTNLFSRRRKVDGLFCYEGNFYVKKIGKFYFHAKKQ